jgi:hypothetical protein
MPAKKKKNPRSRTRKSTAPKQEDDEAVQTSVDLSNDDEYEALIAAMGGSTGLSELEAQPLEPAPAPVPLSTEEIREQATSAVSGSRALSSHRLWL